MKFRFIKFCTYMLVFVMLFSSAGFAEEKSLDDKAYALNVLKILKGMDGDYNYAGQLTRAQAATFVVRLMGKEEYVLSNNKKFVKTPFPDVKEGDWFAPYVGYCFINDIINGDSDGTYKPNDTVSEKAFTKMILGVLGYEYGSDYKWESVFPFAHEKKLVNDISYAVKTDDNKFFYRKDAISLLYQSLVTGVKGGDGSLSEKLVEDKVLSSSKVKALGLLKVDEEKSNIEKIEVVSDHKIIIELNENIKSPVEEDIEIESDGDALDIKSILLEKNKITISTSVMKEKSNYIVLLEKVYDEDDNLVKDIQGTFQSFEKPAIEDPMFKISKVVPINNKEIQVFFTHPITDEGILELLYNIYANDKLFVEGSYKYFDIRRLGSNKKAVSILLKTKELVEGETYKLSVKGDMKSEYDVYLNDGYGDEYEFRGNDSEYENIQVEEVNFASEKYIYVEFNREIDEESVKDKNNYILKDEESGVVFSSPKEIKIEEYGEYKNKRIYIYFTKLKDDRNYTMWVDDVEDLHRQSVTNYEKYELTDYIPDKRLDVDDYELIDSKSFYIYFNERLSKKSENARIKSDGAMRFTDILFDSEYPKRLRVYLNTSSSFKGHKDYEITVNDVYDYLGEEQSEEIDFDIESDNMDPMELEIDEAVFISKKKIMLVLDDDISIAKNKSESLYGIEYKDDGDKVKTKPKDVDIVDSRTIILELDNEIKDSVVVLRMDYLYDYSGNNKIMIGSKMINNNLVE